MSESQPVRSQNPGSSAAAGPSTTGTRVDAAHVLANTPVPAPASSAPVGNAPMGSAVREPVLQAVAGNGDSSAAGADEVAHAATRGLLPRLRLQGRQLAQLLSRRQADLDHREAQQQAQSAEHENQLRAARLWFTEHYQELAQREAQLSERERQVSLAQSRLIATETQNGAARRTAEEEIRRREELVDRRQAELDRTATRLARQVAAQQATQQEFAAHRQREHDKLVHHRQEIDAHRAASAATLRLALAQLEQRRATVEAAVAALAKQRKQWAEVNSRPSPEQQKFARELREIAAGLTARGEQLTLAENLQIRGEAELVELRRSLDEERQRLAEQARVERRRLAESQRQLAAATVQEREALDRQRDEIAHGQASLERLRAELAALHRETLESRLAAEEALARLSGVAAPAVVSRALAETRARLADYWRLAAGRLADERAALTGLRDELAAAARKLAAQKESLEQWVERRQREFDQQGAALDQRASELLEFENHTRAERDNWDRERLAFEQQLRQAAAHLCEGTPE